MLAVIEAGFGDCTGFNRVARAIFAAVGERMQRDGDAALVAVGESGGRRGESDWQSNTRGRTGIRGLEAEREEWRAGRWGRALELRPYTVCTQ